MKLELRNDQYLEVEKLSLGVFRPLENFMDKDQFISCAEEMRLPTGEPFTLPVVFDVEEKIDGSLNKIELTYEGKHVANLIPSNCYEIEKKKYIEKLFGTVDESHPGIKDFLSLGTYFVSGKVELLERPKFSFSDFELTPEQSKSLFKKRGWEKIVGFQTRNVPHRAHEYLQKVALENADGIFIQPLVGKKKAGDFTPEAIIKGYQTLVENYYPENNAIIGVLSTKMRYAGPREAVFHAIIRRNYGCTHFIIGRDHAGVGSFYGKYEAHQLASKFEGELGIELLKLNGPYLCTKCDGIVTSKTCPHEESSYAHPISGTDFRNMLKNSAEIDPKIVRSEVVKSLSEVNIFI